MTKVDMKIFKCDVCKHPEPCFCAGYTGAICLSGFAREPKWVDVSDKFMLYEFDKVSGQ